MASSSTKQQRNGSKKDTPVWSRKYFTGSGVLEVAIWSKTIGEGDSARDVLNTSLKKTYKDGDEYKTSTSFRFEELPIVAAAMQEAFAFISAEMNRE
jgi:hypothetical protein